jgi:hypothetical protein
MSGKLSYSAQDFMRPFFTFLVLVLAPAFYGEQKFPDYPVHAADSYAVTAQDAGIAIGVQPVEDLKDQKTYFDTELTPKGFIPVFIVIENRSKEDSFLFDKSALTYGLADSGISTPEIPSKMRDQAALAGLASLAPAGGFIVMAKVNHASHIQGNLLKKELQSSTVSPATSIHGFLYIPVPKNGSRQKIRIRIPVSKMSAHGSEPVVLDLVF